MTYVISVNGHGNFATAGEAKAFEEGIFEQAKEFVASLEGVSSASFGGNHVSGTLVTSKEQPDA